MILNKKYIFLVLLIALSSCSKNKKNIREMDFKELDNKIQSSIENKDRHRTIEALEQIIEKYPDHKEISKYRLSLGDLYFKKTLYESADKCYEKYVQTNPANSEYVAYKSILSKFYQTLSIDRDATIINTTIAYGKSFLDTPDYAKSKYANDVKDIVHTCERKLIDREVYVFNFYLKHEKFQSAQKRLNYLKVTYLEKYQDIEPRLLFLESKLALCKGNKDEAVQSKNILIKKFPQSQFTAMADKLVNKKSEFIFF